MSKIGLVGIGIEKKWQVDIDEQEDRGVLSYGITISKFPFHLQINLKELKILKRIPAKIRKSKSESETIFSLPILGEILQIIKDEKRLKFVFKSKKHRHFSEIIEIMFSEKDLLQFCKALENAIEDTK